MRIDIHAHTSNHRLWNLHTEDASIGALERWAEMNGIGLICLMATYFPFKKSGLPNRELLARIAGKRLFRAFGSLDVMNNLVEGVRELRELAEAGLIAGIKMYPGYQDFWPSSERVFPIYELARSFNLPVMFHGGYLHHCCPREQRERGQYRCGASACRLDSLDYLSQPRQLTLAVKRFPDVRFVISHLANPHFAELRPLMAQCPNVWTDISGTDIETAEARDALRPELERFFNMPNGVERVMFGTDFPIQSYADSIELVEMMGLSEEEKARVYWKNAARVLNIQVEEGGGL